jgi:DNA-binding NarL/FixJ family response regulator
MIIDDNARFRTLVRSIVSTQSDEVLELDDGIAVNENYADFHPDWVLMDIKMKQVDGLQATRQLIHEFPEARVIILSNHTNKRMVSKGLELGAKAYLPKEDIFAVQKFIRPTTAGEYHALT